MKNKLSKWWIAVVIAAPFALMLCLHIGIALGNYFGFSINVPNVDASTWFIFCGSYLGGVMTLAGVMITLRHERGLQRYEKAIENINKEQAQLGSVICQLKPAMPCIILQHFLSLSISKDGYNALDIAAIRNEIYTEMQTMNDARKAIFLFTDIFQPLPSECPSCKNPCNLKDIAPEFQRIFEELSTKIFDVLQKIDNYVRIARDNALLNSLIRNCNESNELHQSRGEPAPYGETEIRGYESKLVDTKPLQDELFALVDEVGRYNQKEIPRLIALTREYSAVKKENARRTCFPDKEV